MTAMLGGEIKVAWLDMATGTAAVRSGKIHPVALCTRPTASFPDVGTYKAQGVDFDQWTGWAMFAPPNLPKPILEKLAKAVKDTINDPAVSAKLLDWGITAEFIPGDQRNADNAKDIQAWRKIATDAGMKFD
jgi:tripartite-type tricarboxylate transporter receptor subunit TctC